MANKNRWAAVLTAGALAALTTACSGPVTYIPEPSAQSRYEAQYAWRGFDPRRKERQVGAGALDAWETVERVWRRVMPAALSVCARLFASGCPEAFASMRPRVEPADDTVNALAYPDGTLGFYGGLIRLTGNDDELAAVMAHEAAHVLYGHSAKQAGNMRGGALLGALIGALGCQPGMNCDSAQIGMMVGHRVGAFAYSPEMELEADHFAVFALQEAGYDPEKGGKVFVRMANTMYGDQQSGRRSFISYFRTHPANDHRLAVWQEGVRMVRQGHRTPKRR